MSDPPAVLVIWATLHRTHARVLGELTHRMEATCGVSVLAHGSLYQLNAAPGRVLRMARLADLLGLSPSATTRLVDRLEECGWVRREVPPGDRRAINVQITSEGRLTFVRNNRLFLAAVEQTLGGQLSGDELAQLRSLLDRLGTAENCEP